MSHLTAASAKSSVPALAISIPEEAVMQRKAIWASIVVVLLGVLLVAQAQESYLEVFVVQVKPEKRADFDAISKKIVAANRQSSGDSASISDAGAASPGRSKCLLVPSPGVAKPEFGYNLRKAV